MSQVLPRLIAAIIGGYLLTWSVAAFVMAGLVLVGTSFHDAETTVFMLAPLFYLTFFLCTFAVKSMRWIWFSVLFVTPVLWFSALSIQSSILG